MANPFHKSVSFWVLVGVIVLFLLQAFPPSGIFLMFFGAMFVAGILVHVFLVAVFIESLCGRLPRLLIALPVAAYVGYYAAYVGQGVLIKDMSAELRTTNVGKVLDFDPARHFLVMNNAEQFVETHDIPAAYWPNKNMPELRRYGAARLIPKSICPSISNGNNEALAYTFPMRYNHDPAAQSGACLLTTSEKQPSGEPVFVVERDHASGLARFLGITAPGVDIVVGRKVVGSLQRLRIDRMPDFPVLVLGCALVDQPPGWPCAFTYFGRNETVEWTPPEIGRTAYDDPVGILLGIRKYTNADLVDFHGFPENAEAVRLAGLSPFGTHVTEYSARALVDGGPMSASLWDAIRREPDVLVPYADDLANRYVELNRPPKAGQILPVRRLEALAAAINLLPKEAFLRVANRIFVSLTEEHSYRNRILYLRLAELGESTLPFYRQEFMRYVDGMDDEMLPALAICRIGKADDALIDELKKRYSQLNRDTLAQNYRSALFLALMAVGQEAYLHQNNAPGTSSMAQENASWYKLVTDGKATTEVGPNNCMPLRWGRPFRVAMPSEMAWSLVFSKDQGWRAPDGAAIH